MAATATQQKAFVMQIAPIMLKYAKERGYKNVSAAIAQACLESGYGLSGLAAKYHNYFGLKCGKSWKGNSVNMRTMEEYTKGVLTSIKDNFRVYDSMEEGVKGYYDFIKAPRYAACKNCQDPKSYLKAIKAAGYATSSTYVKNNMTVVWAHNLTEWDKALDGGLVPTSDTGIGQANNVPDYNVGEIYTCHVELNVRTGPGTGNRKKTHDELTEDARKHDLDKDGAIDRYTKVKCLEIKRDGSDVWIRIPSGWIAAYWKGNKYVF